MDRTEEIGVLVFDEPAVISNDYDATWWERVQIEPGRYPLRAHFGSPDGLGAKPTDQAYWGHCSIPGVVKSTELDRPRPGEPATARLSCIYGYDLAKLAASGDRTPSGYRVELTSGYEVRPTHGDFLGIFRRGA